MSQMMARSVVKPPSPMRFERVQSILEAEPAFRDRIGPKSEKIEKANGTAFLFSKGVVEVTWHLHRNGLDAHNADRTEVIAAAGIVLELLKTSKPKPAKKPLKPAKPVKVVKPVKAKRAVQLPKPVPAATVPAPEPAPVVEKPSPEPSQPAAAEPPILETPPAGTPSDPNQVPVYYIYATSFTMIANVRQLMEGADNQPGADGRLQRIDDLMEELYKLKDVGVPLPMNMLPNSIRHGKADGKAAASQRG